MRRRLRRVGGEFHINISNDLRMRSHMNVMPFWTSPHPGLPMSRWSGDGRIALKAALQPRRGGGHAAACERAADLLHDRKLVAQLCVWPSSRIREMVHSSCTQRSTASRFCSLTLRDGRRRLRATPMRQRSADRTWTTQLSHLQNCNSALNFDFE